MSNQDALMKALTRSLSGGALDALGVYGVELVESVETELPANVLRMDRVWRTRDGQLFHLEFQATREPTLHRFLEYDARLANRMRCPIRTVILYHASIGSAPSELNIGTAQYRVENVFLAEVDGDEALNEVERHLREGRWEARDRLRLALALNMRLGNPQQAFDRVLSLVGQVQDEEERELVVSALLTLGDQALSDEERIRLRKELRRMYRLIDEIFEDGRKEGRLEGFQEGLKEGLEKGMAQGLEQGLAQGLEKGIAQGLEKGMEKGVELGTELGLRKAARNLLAAGIPCDLVERATGLPRGVIEDLQRHIDTGAGG
ncbi:RpnC/YadD family protein [Alicyclobacillus vulcanalis]|uniref:Transposase, YhgA-like n=2 Tax=Alicyclobacillus TaxID=29330 RepID=A0A1N7MHM0_9BACL|nr:hypothetical protein [Alicyclobacillus vulcanalis]SIS85684.1 hypothetical protein SAMN05421799_105163 [Alicyclobacillus vulcanalis]